jgi:hypothetical protein
MADTLHISDIELYNLLKVKVGEQEAEQLVKFVQTEVENSVEAEYEYFSKDISGLNNNLIKILKA